MGSMVDVLGLYHNYQNVVELILELYCEAAKRMLCYLNTTASRTLYEQTINLIQMYAHHNQGKRCIEKEAEEDQFKDILLLMELLTSILSKDFIDLAPPDANATDNGVAVADVCLHGLNLVRSSFSCPCAQCRNFRIFLSFLFYVKSTFGECRSSKTAILCNFWGSEFCQICNSAFKRCKLH